MSADKDNSFITEHFALVHSIASRFRNRGIEYDELFSAGCVGLVKAGNNFDESRGLKFSTYAVPVIMGEIKQLFRDGGTVKVSRSLKELSLKICRLRDELIKNGEEPHISVLAEKLGITPEEASLALGASLPPVSLSSYDDEENDEGSFDLPVEPEQPKALDRKTQSTIIATRPVFVRVIGLPFFFFFLPLPGCGSCSPIPEGISCPGFGPLVYWY